MHGSAKGDVRDKANVQVAAAQLGVLGLPPKDTVRVVQRVLSDRMLDAAGVLRAAAEEGRQVDPEEHQRFVEASDRALVAARVALAAGVEDGTDSRDDEAGELVARALSWAIDGVLEVLSLSPERRLQMRRYALEMGQWALEGGNPEERPADPVLLPERVAVGELLPAPARRRAPTPDEIWAEAEQLVDAEIVEEDDDDDDTDAGPGTAA